jgi:hypothetical protein
MDDTTDAEVLFPDAIVRVGDEDITVREFGFAEQMRFSASMRGLMARIFADFSGEQAGDMRAVIRDHFDDWMRLLSAGTGKPVEWLADHKNVSDADGIRLSVVLWNVNKAFFCREIWAADKPTTIPTDAPSG